MTMANAETTTRPVDAPGPVRDLGAAAIDLFIGGRELYSVFVRTLYYVFRGRVREGEGYH